MRSRLQSGAAVLGFVGVASIAGAAIPTKSADKMPITTSSQDARKLYLDGRDLVEKLQATDARRLFTEAAAKDPGFALAQVGLANTAGTTKEFLDAVAAATRLSSKASEPERLWIEALQAGVRGDVPAQGKAFQSLVALLPRDERAHNLLGGYYFAQQDFPAAIAAYEKAVAINPEFSQPYNQLGYAYRFVGKMTDAERTFQKYIQLIPGDPNPYDSYAEFLMKTGRFDESIKAYQKALTVNPSFVASYVGIANNRIFMGQGEEARKALGQLSAAARNHGETALALFWTAISYVHENATDKALAEIDKADALSREDKDGATLSGNANFRGNILLEAGRVDEAAAQFAQVLTLIDAADVPAGVKETAHRNALFNDGRVALARKDTAAAKAIAASYTKQVLARGNPLEVRQQHELVGRVALAEQRWDDAVAALQQANQQDPRTLYLLALAYQGKGDVKQAREFCRQVAEWNSLFGNYAYVRAKAKEMLART